MFLPLFFGFRLAFISSPCLCPLKVCRCCARVLCPDKSSLLSSSLSFLLVSPAHPIIPLPSPSISVGFHHLSAVSTTTHLPPPFFLLSFSFSSSSSFFLFNFFFPSPFHSPRLFLLPLCCLLPLRLRPLLLPSLPLTLLFLLFLFLLVSFLSSPSYFPLPRYKSSSAPSFLPPLYSSSSFSPSPTLPLSLLPLPPPLPSPSSPPIFVFSHCFFSFSFVFYCLSFRHGAELSSPSHSLHLHPPSPSSPDPRLSFQRPHSHDDHLWHGPRRDRRGGGRHRLHPPLPAHRPGQIPHQTQRSAALPLRHPDTRAQGRCAHACMHESPLEYMHINMDAQVPRQAKRENIRVVCVWMQVHGDDLTPGSSNVELLERNEQQTEAAWREHHIQCTTISDFFFSFIAF